MRYCGCRPSCSCMVTVSTATSAPACTRMRCTARPGAAIRLDSGVVAAAAGVPYTRRRMAYESKSISADAPKSPARSRESISEKRTSPPLAPSFFLAAIALSSSESGTYCSSTSNRRSSPSSAMPRIISATASLLTTRELPPASSEPLHAVTMRLRRVHGHHRCRVRRCMLAHMQPGEGDGSLGSPMHARSRQPQSSTPCPLEARAAAQPRGRQRPCGCG
mmetsp:Transcript_37004/g.109072  ORF Transcript_37004/g.109072 Transcript_37004/m.109072 type:complete len:220 (+) Transcript_37004:662-1321(+)